MQRPVRQVVASDRPPLCQPQVPCRKLTRGHGPVHQQQSFSLCRRRAANVVRARRSWVPCQVPERTGLHS
jgi:hypothetical protein